MKEIGAEMIEYPKIDTLYDRDPNTFKVIPGELRLIEFGNIKEWFVTEKVDGTNIRIKWLADEKRLLYGGRTDNAQMPTSLMIYLQETFKPEMFSDFKNDMILFGEGYGEKIQKGGGNYRKGVSFRLFDILIGDWWLEPENVFEIADKLSIKTVPILGKIDYLPTTIADLGIITAMESYVANEDGGAGMIPEGVVARTHPLLFTRKGERLIWKLKFRDF